MPFPTAISQFTLSNMIVAFDMLIEEIEIVLRSINSVGASAFESNDYDAAYKAIENALKIKTLYQDIHRLKEGLNDFSVIFQVHEKQRISALTPVRLQKRVLIPASRPQTIDHNKLPSTPGRLIAGRIRKGLRTQEAAFFRPILQVLNDLGGSAKRGTVLEL